MGWMKDITETSTSDLAARHGAPLLAQQLQSTCRNYLESLESYRAEIARLKGAISDAERIGLAVMRAESKGRKTVRVAELMAVVNP